jgi:transposase
MKKVFIGVDFSKKKVDVSVLYGSDMSVLGQECFANELAGCKEMLAWVKGLTNVPRKEWMFCGEHTGLYSVALATFLAHKKLFLWLENPLEIKQSSGIRRGKSDSADSLMIARYAARNRDKAKAYQLPDEDMCNLERLMSYRRLLIKNKKGLLVSAVEVRAQYQRNKTTRFIYERSMSQVNRINKDIKECEASMMEIIEANESLKENYDIVSSIKGIAFVNTITILIATQNFTTFENSRQFACYAGLAPFGKTSGTSIHVTPHVSHYADKNIKSLLTQAALVAIKFNPQMRDYYQRKISEGKHHSLVINNVRNKLIHCVFSLIKRRDYYDEEHVYLRRAKENDIAYIK